MKNYKVALAALLAASLTLSNVSITFAEDQQPQENPTNYEYNLASDSNATYSEVPEIASPSEATPSKAKEKVSEPSGLYWDDYVATWEDNSETDCSYLLSVKVRSGSKSVTTEIETIFTDEDLEDTIQYILDQNNMAGLCVKVKFKVKAIVSEDDEDYCSSNWSEWSDDLELEQEREELEIPSNLSWDNSVAMWDSVEHASGYYVVFEIILDDVCETFSSYPKTNSLDVRKPFDITCKERNLANGTYSVRYKVTALGGDTGASAAYVSSEASDWSEDYEFEYGTSVTQLETPTIVLGSDLVANWNEIENVYDYYINFRVQDNNGFDNVGSIVTSNTTVDVAQSVNEVLNQFSKANGEYSVSVRIMSRSRFDDTEHSNSEVSEWTDPVSYTYGITVETLTAPSNLSWNGYVVSWDSVNNADYYTVGYNIAGDDSWTMTSNVNSLDLEKFIKESSVKTGLTAGSYEVCFRVMSNAKYDNVEYKSSDWSNWSDIATYTIASDIKKTTTSGGSTSGGGGSSSGGSGGGGGSVSGPVNEMNSPMPSYVETTGSWAASDNGSWTYSNNGVQYKDTTVAIKVGNGYAWYRFDKNGSMITGWYTDPTTGNMYYYSQDKSTIGMLLTGTQNVNGTIYEFDTTGKFIKIIL